MKKAYELTDAEAALVEGFRQGHVTLPDEWLKVTAKEREAILNCRRIAFGSVTLRLVACEPVEMVAEVHLLLGKGSNDEERLKLIRGGDAEE